MNDENAGNVPSGSTAPVATNATPNPLDTLRNDVKSGISVSGATVRAKVVEMLVGDEIRSRTDIVLAAFNLAEVHRKNLEKIKPDIVGYDETGKVTSSAYSKKLLDERKNLEGKIKKINDALTAALDNNDFSKLQQVVKETANPAST